MERFREIMELVGLSVDVAGVVVIVVGMLIATARVLQPHAPSGHASRYRVYRQDVGRAILLGLEFLVAADIIRTVVVEPTLDNALGLGVIVIIRTFLSMSLAIELEGRLPWKEADAELAQRTR